MRFKPSKVTSSFALACTGAPTLLRAMREIHGAIKESIARIQQRLQRLHQTNRSPQQETFDAALNRLQLVENDLVASTQVFQKRSGNWFLLCSLAFAFLIATPLVGQDVTSHWVSHLLLSSGVMVVAAAKALVWHFRACQIRERNLYAFGQWFKQDYWVRRGFFALALGLLLMGVLASTVVYSASMDFGQFKPAAGDASVAFLRQIFGNVIDQIHAGADPGTETSTNALSRMLGPFNSAVLFLGMLFISYTTIKGAIDSAHDGELLGKKMSSAWLPLRTVAAAGLLLPLGSGYSLIQIGVLWLVVQSVGLAGVVISAGLDYVAETNMVMQPHIPDARPLAANILRFEVCRAALNQQFGGSGRYERIVLRERPQTVVPSVDKPTFNSNLDVIPALKLIRIYQQAKQLIPKRYTVINFEWRAQYGSYLNPVVCGALKWQEAEVGGKHNSDLKIAKGPIMAAHAQAVREMIKTLQPFAETLVAGEKPEAGVLEAAAAQYENALVAAAKKALQQTNDVDRANFLQWAKEGGWIFLPTYYNHFIQLNDAMQSALNTLPVSHAVEIEDKEVQTVLRSYQDALLTAEEYIKHRDAAPRKAYQQQAAASTRLPRSWEDAKRLIASFTQDAIYQFTQELAGSNLSHIGQIKALGDSIIHTGEALLGALFTINGLSHGNGVKLTLGTIFDIGAAVSSISGMLTTLALTILFFGAWAAYYVPMIPFITAVTAVIKWFVLVFESVIAAPIFALAHLHPDGGDVVGKGGPGYMLILGNFLRPTLTVFGFFGSIWLVQPVAGFINAAYITAVAGAEYNSLSGVVAFLAYVAIYVMLMTGVVHSIFTLVNWLPDNVLNWLGGVLDNKDIGGATDASGGFKGVPVDLPHGADKEGHSADKANSKGGRGKHPATNKELLGGHS